MHIVRRTLLASALLFAASPSIAGTISIATDFQGVAVGYHHTNPIIGATVTPVPLGSVDMSGGSSVPGFHFGGAFEAYCVEILGEFFDIGIPPPTTTVDATGAPMSGWQDVEIHDADNDPDTPPVSVEIGVDGGGARAAWLYNTFNPLIQPSGPTTSLTFDLPVSDITAPGDVARTALAMSIWEVLYDHQASSVSPGQGEFWVNCERAGSACTDVIALANGFLLAAAGQTSDATWLQLTSGGQPIQDFIGPAAAQTVPEPASAWFLAAGLVGLIVSRPRTDC